MLCVYVCCRCEGCSVKLRITVSDVGRVAVQCQWKLCVIPELTLQRETILLRNTSDSQ